MQGGKDFRCKLLYFSWYALYNFNELDSKFIVDIYNELSYIASESDVKLAQENVSWCMSSDIKFLNLLTENCKYPVYFTLDLKQAYKANVPIEKYIKVMGTNIVNLHINDRDENSPCLMPGKGNLNYKDICK